MPEPRVRPKWDIPDERYGDHVIETFVENADSTNEWTLIVRDKVTGHFRMEHLHSWHFASAYPCTVTQVVASYREREIVKLLASLMDEPKVESDGRSERGKEPTDA